ncbi:ParM/StbA family protein [Clostridium sp. FP2]|uniref:ParM/StbA family protein n=1 Tax=Clostridium sp. FP2 TaxID=2724481 RepID=UPI0013E8FB8C|nr:ParM/StbA family protein [Clostridium sp. FP2]MBZ9622942.1 ParM/StbA family protein [Clostridium sp. FP2]
MQIKEIFKANKPKVIVGVDNGYYGTKISTKDKSIYLRSKYEKSNDILNKDNTYLLHYNNTDYIVGAGAELSSIDYDKTADEMYKIITYAGLSILSDFVGTDFYLVGSYPLSIYNQNKDHFASYLKGTGVFETKLNEEPKKFNIVKSITFPQGVSHAYNQPKLFQNQMRGILDFGGLTINCCVLSDMNIVPGTGFTENLGSIILENEIKKKLDTKFNLNIKDYELPSIIKNGIKVNGVLMTTSCDIIKSTINEHMNKIKKAMRSNNWNVESLDLFATGGSSLDYSSQLKSTFPQIAISDDCINDGSKGLLVVGNLIYGDDVNGK